jgi:glycosyltransferase involved in cell wall biosynthesis
LYLVKNKSSSFKDFGLMNSMDKKKLPVTVVIPCCNGGHYLKKCLEGVFAQGACFEEVVVVDDGSSDDTSNIALSHQVTLLKNESTRGLAFSRNRGLREARSKYILFLDCDVELSEDWLDKAYIELSKGGFTAIGGGLVEVNTVRAADRWRARHMIQDNGGKKEVFNSDNLNRLSGFAFAIERQKLLAIGGYNELFGRSYEDVDVSIRLIEAGGHLCYCPDLLAYHHKRDSVLSVLASCWSWDHWESLSKGCYSQFWQAVRKVFRNGSYLINDLVKDLQSLDFKCAAITILMFILFNFWDLRLYIFWRFGSITVSNLRYYSLRNISNVYSEKIVSDQVGIMELERLARRELLL